MAKKKIYRFYIKLEFDVLGKGETMEEALDSAAEQFESYLGDMRYYDMKDYLDGYEIVEEEATDEHAEDE